MVIVRPSRSIELAVVAFGLVLIESTPALAQQGQVLTTLENSVVAAAKGWETTVMDAARSLFWILAGIEVGIAAVWLAINAASLDSWFAELVKRIMFIGLFAFILDQGPAFAKAVVDSLYQIGAGGGSASPANIFDAGIRVATKMSEQAKFGLWEDNALAIAAVFAMVVVVVCFSLVAAIFVSVMVEMYVGLLAGMIMLGLGGTSYTKDFALKYLVYAFSVGMKLMALVMIAKIGSDILLGLAEAPTATSEQFITTLAIAGISVVVFVIAMYVPPILQGVVQGASVTSGMEAIRHGGQAASAALGASFLATAAASRGFQAASAARAGGASLGSAAMRGMESGIGGAAGALSSAAKDKAIVSPGAYAGSLLGLANAKLDQQSGRTASPPPPPPLNETK
ncbi:P-type conjugative transfer protein TrbL [Rhizobium skierniewicense]|uniref:P-type conjugative transfer protein TrbL n=1 Tax=Rhizobium skierniewicense TaxID=984260 RepID=UPI001FAB9E34|nr:P-type conjugative transfer protein TrbL [Rhizobium skierniewicense]MCI9868622.1 P-type conjugative transfer protein TrbL [Rhizobium skierniewicense]